MRRGVIFLCLVGLLLVVDASSSPVGVDGDGRVAVAYSASTEDPFGPAYRPVPALFEIHLAEEEFTGQFPTTLRLEGTGFCPRPGVRIGVPGFGLLETTVLDSTDQVIRVALFGDDFAPYTAGVVVKCPGATRRFSATLGLVGGGLASYARMQEDPMQR